MSFRYGRLEVIPEPISVKTDIEQDRSKAMGPRPRER